MSCENCEESAYVIDKLAKLLAEIAVIVNGPEPHDTLWSYHDLPEKVRALKAPQPAQVARWMVFNVGCIECGVSSDVVGIYSSEDEAHRVAVACSDALEWREDGQNRFEVFDILKPMADEYRAALAAAKGEK